MARPDPVSRTKTIMPPANDYSPWNLTVAEIVGRLESLLGRPGVEDEYVRLRIALVETQRITFEDLEDSPIVPLSATAMESKRRCRTPRTGEPGGVGSADVADHRPRPVLQPRDIGFDQAIALRLFSSILRECRRYGAAQADVEKLESAVRDRPKLLAGFVRYGPGWPDATYPGKLAGRLAVAEEMLLLVGHLVAAPFAAHAARRLREEPIAEFASGGSCPMCGAAPALASLTAAEGRRMLHCPLCGQVWPFDRLRCPFCGDESSSGPVRLAIDGLAPSWIEACDRCHHYLQVNDLRHPEVERPLVPLAEKTAGIAFDLVAERHGYLRKPPYAALW